MNQCTRTFAVLSAAAALTLGTTVYGQGAPAHSGIPPVNDPAGSAGEIGGRALPPGGKAPGDVPPEMMANMEADRMVNMQLGKFAMNADKMADQKFALEAGAGNMQEIEFSKLVAEKATDPKVKDLAMMIMKDHKMAQDKLKPIGEKLGVMYPAALPTMKQNELNFLANLPPEKMMKAYLGMMKAGHLMTVANYDDATKYVMDPELKAYVTETLPKIREHTAAILKCNADMGMDTDLNFKAPMGGM